MPQRKPVKAQQHELDAFAERYDLYADMFGDPIEFMFRVMANKLPDDVVVDVSDRRNAAEVLMSHRFPKVKAQEISNPNAPPINFSINITPTPALPTAKVIEIKSTPHLPERK